LKVFLAIFAAVILGFALDACNRSEEPGTCPPLPGWLKPSHGIGHLRPYNRVSLTAEGNVIWNGRAIAKSSLLDLMIRRGELEPTPQIILEVSPKTKCALANGIRNTMSATPICREMRLCGEGHGWVANSDVGNPHQKKLDF
jgi:hypothetical protein